MRIPALTFCTLLTSTALATPAFGQAGPPPRFLSVDDNGVDLISGKVRFSLDEGGIGSGEGAIRMTRIWTKGVGWTYNWNGRIGGDGTNTLVEFDGISDPFSQSGTTFTSLNAQGATLVFDATANEYLYTAADGTKLTFTGSSYLATKIVRPNGVTFDLTWHDDNNIATVTSSTGYQATVSYGTDPVTGDPRRTGVSFTNLLSTPASLPTISYAYPASNVVEVTDTGGRVWRLTGSIASLNGVRRPASTSDDISYTFSGPITNRIVASATVDGVTTNYSRSSSGTTATWTITNTLGSQTLTTVALVDTSKDRVTSVTDPLSRTTGYQYDSSARLTRITQPESNYTQFTYDSRGNVTETRSVAKPSTGLPDIVSSSSFDSSCINPVTCNLPNSITDARGNTTDYTYDSTHGGVLTVTAPAATTSANRPQLRYSYSRLDSSGAPDSAGMFQLTGTSACQTGTAPSCVGSADEVKSSITYGQNLNAASVSSGNGTGTLTATSAITYDPIGNLLTIDGPLATSADTTRYRYNAAREVIGIVGPDPDGSGSRKHLAQKVTVDSSTGLVTKQEIGTVNGYSDSDWAAFATAQETQLLYNANRRLSRSTLVSGSTAYAVSQFSYDALGRLDCSAQRMKYVSLPSSACTPETPAGTFGDDRISKLVYDAGGQVTETRVLVGLSGEYAERTLTYTNNGLVQTLKDGENNLTTFEYDGQDRLWKTFFPHTTKGSGTSSSTDYEQLTYENTSSNTRTSGTVASRRLRDNSSMTFAYDNLGRLVTRGAPSPDPTVTYAYDLMSRLTTATKSSVAVTFAYDALSRQTGDSQAAGGITRTFDLAGSMTRTTWSDGFYADYDRDVTGQLLKVRENGATSGAGVLASFDYDNLGRRTLLTRGNGTTTSYSYDAVSRLTSIANNLTGTADDLTISSIDYNPASQIVGEQRSNEAYSWTGGTTGSMTTVTNGLNELVTVNSVSAGYDARGNLTGDPVSGKTLSYWPSTDQLRTVTSPYLSLGYDGLDRLAEYENPTSTRFVNDGMQIAAEVNSSGNVTKRYVWGDGPDELLLDYVGSGTTTRRSAHADERGSIVALSDGSGAAAATYRYDEYGRPQDSSTRAFMYTGQMWMPEASAYHYKLRAYQPALGRFLQTDPIGYDGGENLYAYVLNDPVNYVDPFGLRWVKHCDIYHPNVGVGDEPHKPGPPVEICRPKWEDDRLGTDPVRRGTQSAASRTKAAQQRKLICQRVNAANFLINLSGQLEKGGDMAITAGAGAAAAGVVAAATGVGLPAGGLLEGFATFSALGGLAAKGTAGVLNYAGHTIGALATNNRNALNNTFMNGVLNSASSGRGGVAGALAESGIQQAGQQPVPTKYSC